ncbi:hypothetical protein, partial [Piscirickettsia salmonis]|uniref:hypothetical protein n=1 Tax=Piscirickettsia salmonis TaxID=1238 RepID=UPI000332BDF3
SALLKTRTYLGLLTPCLALHGSQRTNNIEFKIYLYNKKLTLIISKAHSKLRLKLYKSKFCNRFL